VALAIGIVVVAVIAVTVPIGGSPGPSQIVVRGSPLLNRPAPPIDLVALDGERVQLSDYIGRPVIVNFWASSCLPCRDEFPLFVEALEQHQDDGLEVLGVIHDDSNEAAQAFATAMGGTWPMLPDPAGVAWNAWLGVGLPTTYYIDPEGVVRDFSLGPVTRSGLAIQIARILPSATNDVPEPTTSGR
jgi:cytochrome c biogenesis protein CcmG/thiol:disulfide interchange protein DsbE